MSDPILVLVHRPLERRYCSADSPMAMADKDRFQWGHPDAAAVKPFFNLVIYRCPHCNLYFHAPARPEGATA
jgi:hypothetical protein